MNQKEQNIESMISVLEENINNYGGHYIIGIDGYSGSGKTSLSQKLIEYFKKNFEVYIFHLDDHITTRNHRYNTGYEQWYEYFKLQWDVDYIIEYLLKPLKNNTKEINLDYYNNDLDLISECTINIAARSIIIIEGIFLQRDEWRKYLDFVFFIDCPRELRFERELIRSRYNGNIDELLPKYRERYWAAEDYYEDSYNPKHSCDMVIKNY